jgi:hypothetical protein
MLGEKWYQRQPGGWYKPLENPVRDIADAAASAAPLIHEDLRQLYMWENADCDELKQEVIELPEIATPRLNDRLAAKHHSLAPGETREGEVTGIRGGIVATDKFVLNFSKHDGRVVTIELDDDFLDDVDFRVMDSPEDEMNRLNTGDKTNEITESLRGGEPA